MSLPASASSRLGDIDWRWALPRIALVFLVTRLLILGVAVSVEATQPDLVPPAYLLSDDRPILSTLTAWDGAWYRSIAEDGYHAEVVRWPDYAFYPLYPAALRVVSFATLGDTGIAAIVLSNAAFVLALVALYALSVRYLTRERAMFSLWLLALAPGAIAFTLAYTESLFLLLAVAAFLAAENRRPWVVGILVALATLTRPTGILLLVPLAVLYAQRDGWRPTRAWAPLVLAPVAMLLWYAYLWWLTGDPMAAFHAQSYWDVPPDPSAGAAATSDHGSLPLGPVTVGYFVLIGLYTLTLVYVGPERFPVAYRLMVVVVIGSLFLVGRLDFGRPLSGHRVACLLGIRHEGIPHRPDGHPRTVRIAPGGPSLVHLHLERAALTGDEAGLPAGDCRVDSPFDPAAARESTIGRIDEASHTGSCEIACQQLKARAVSACLAERGDTCDADRGHVIALQVSGTEDLSVRWPSAHVRAALLRVVLLALSILGWALFARIVVVNILAMFANPGDPVAGLGEDTYAYWLAGANVIDGEPLYWATTIDEVGGYRYPPPFAQMWAPFSFAPEAVAEWAWRILGVLSIRYMAGSWMVTGLWWLYPGTLYELSFGNVTFQVAALTVAALRGRAEGVFPATLVKFSAVVVVPFLWLRRTETRRGLVLGGVIAAAIVAVSALIASDLWRAYFGVLGAQGSLSFEGTSIIHILPTPASDYLLRIAIAAAIVIASIRFDSPHLAFVASVLAIPTIWEQRLSVLFALLTLEGGMWLKPYLWPWRQSRRPHEAAGAPGEPPMSHPADTLPIT